LGKGKEKESVKEDHPLSENTAITAISSLLVLPLCVWQVEALAYISQEGKVERANDNTKIWSFPILVHLLLFFNLFSVFCHPAKEDLACCS
jgi:hypothetical protein